MTHSILFPADYFAPAQVDDAFKREANTVANEVNIACVTDEGKFRKLLPEGNVLYRGWMLSLERYSQMHAALVNTGVQMVTTPEQYVTAHHLPGWVDVFHDLTAATVVVPIEDYNHQVLLAAPETLPSSAYVVKDYIKSRKHEWETACFAGSLAELPAIVDEFIRLQEDSLVGGIVVREFLNIDKTVPELRTWWVRNRMVAVTAHPDNLDLSTVALPEVFVNAVSERVEALGCAFVTVDIVRLIDGSFRVIEVGDGQVSGFHADLPAESISSILEAAVSGEVD